MPNKRTSGRPTKIPGIVRDKDGRFVVRVRWTDEKTGKRRKTQKVVATMEEALLLRAQGPVRGPRETAIRQRFVDYATQWMKENAADRAPATRERYVAELARISVVLGDYYVDAIEEQDVRAWRDHLAREVANSTVNAHLRTLRVVLEPLARSGVLRRNPARDVPALKTGRTKGARGTALNPEQFGCVVRATQELMGDEFPADIGRMILTLAWTGMRKGELLGVKWVDYVDGELFVRRAVCKITRTEKTTKTDDPRLVPVSAPLASVLDEQRRWLVETQHPGLASGLVFPANPMHAKGGKTRRALDAVCWYRAGSVLDRPLRLVVAKAGVPRITPHSFRRTYENLLRQAGVNDLVRRSLAGWRTTHAQAIYAGIDRTERTAASERMVELVGAGEKQ